MKSVCPHHKGDNTPSLHTYPDGSQYCFGCGHYSGPNSEKKTEPQYNGPPEDIQYNIGRIKGLKKIFTRGMWFHADRDGFYILYPDGKYYVKRNANPDFGKYVGPRGHKKPLFRAKELSPSKPLIIIEGQLNALSLAEVGVSATVVSPGAATDFKKINHLPYYCVYNNIVLVLDNDAPGALGAIELKAQLLKFPEVKNVLIKLVDKDANDILQEKGSIALKEEYEAYLNEVGMP